jgi:transcriptional regulator with XRE-family HTH domain
MEQLRESLGLSQAAFARKLSVSPMAVSRWERGINEPTASIYIELGKISGHPKCWFFWGRAGLDRADLDRALGQAAADGGIPATPPTPENVERSQRVALP